MTRLELSVSRDSTGALRATLLDLISPYHVTRLELSVSPNSQAKRPKRPNQHRTVFQKQRRSVISKDTMSRSTATEMKSTTSDSSQSSPCYLTLLELSVSRDSAGALRVTVLGWSSPCHMTRLDLSVSRDSAGALRVT